MEVGLCCRLKRPGLLILQSALFLLGTEAVTEVNVRLGEGVKLPCGAQYKSGVQYRAISWYKVADDGSFSGIVRKDIKENIDRKYLGYNGSVELASAIPYSLIIHNVSSEDLGTYRCSFWAPLGEQNKQADMRLQEGDDPNQSEGINWITLSLIIVGVSALPVLCMYLVYMKCIRETETCTKQKMKNYTQLFGDKRLFYSII
ncbi:CD83 antigen-like isoform X2 [Heptranchias perlo]|uniref:CD83 antigen-like isoform X2 n=1 Tax=Heptranchias perlo TaxID=212740 RepID=UPI003559628D